jgi:precorrin-6B methylase 1
VGHPPGARPSGGQPNVAAPNGSAPAAAAAPARRGQLVVVGTGLRTVGQLTTEAIAWIGAADKVLYVVGDPVGEEVLHTLNPAGAESLQVFYGEGKRRIDTYEQMTARILECVRAGQRVCAVFYGHPGVFVYPSHEAVQRARAEGYPAVMLPGVSAEDCLFADVGVDPATTGCLSYEATDFLFNRRPADPAAALVLWQIGVIGNEGFTAGSYDTPLMPLLVRKLARWYPLSHEVVVYEAAVHVGCVPRLTRVPIARLPVTEMSAATTLFVPPAAASVPDMLTMQQASAVPAYGGARMAHA